MSEHIVEKNRAVIEGRIAYSFKNKELIDTAFVHKSLFYEVQEINESLERLEFFGDALLNLLITEHLMKLYEDESEGDLSRRRSQLIDTAALSLYLKKLNVLEFLRTSKGVNVSSKMKADLFEAILGAIYFDCGFDRARQWFFLTFHEIIRDIDASKVCDYKGALQDYLQKQYRKKPEYKLIEKSSNGFLMGAYFDGQLLASGLGNAKKEAEMLAAKKALEKIKGDAI